MTMAKFIQTVSDEQYAKLEAEAKKRDTTVQQLIRVVIIPDWFEKEGKEGRRPHEH
jgi:hypothetical protein